MAHPPQLIVSKGNKAQQIQPCEPHSSGLPLPANVTKSTLVELVTSVTFVAKVTRNDCENQGLFLGMSQDSQWWENRAIQKNVLDGT
jgi:hypothetical protein